ncbi:MAG: hypothetical protein ACO29V_02575, partial [Limnohabitans sp.]
ICKSVPHTAARTWSHSTTLPIASGEVLWSFYAIKPLARVRCEMVFTELVHFSQLAKMPTQLGRMHKSTLDW